MREVRKKSVVPVYGVGVVWVIYCLFFPLYKLWHFIILAALSAVVWLVLSKLFPGKTELIKEPEPEPEPVTTGNPEHDALLREGETAVSEMKRLRQSIKEPEIQAKIDRLTELTEKIFNDLIDDPSDYKMIKRFSSYFLPTTINLLNSYDRMGSVGVDGENISQTKARIKDILDTTITAYEKQLDALFANQALDIETDITVLENMLKKEGLSGSDF